MDNHASEGLYTCGEERRNNVTEADETGQSSNVSSYTFKGLCFIASRAKTIKTETVENKLHSIPTTMRDYSSQSSGGDGESMCGSFKQCHPTLQHPSHSHFPILMSLNKGFLDAVHLSEFYFNQKAFCLHCSRPNTLFFLRTKIETGYSGWQSYFPNCSLTFISPSKINHNLGWTKKRSQWLDWH